MLQVFESHADLLSPSTFKEFCLPVLDRIQKEVTQLTIDKGLEPVPMVRNGTGTYCCKYNSFTISILLRFTGFICQRCSLRFRRYCKARLQCNRFGLDSWSSKIKAITWQQGSTRKSGSSCPFWPEGMIFKLLLIFLLIGLIGWLISFMGLIGLLGIHSKKCEGHDWRARNKKLYMQLRAWNLSWNTYRKCPNTYWSSSFLPSEIIMVPWTWQIYFYFFFDILYKVKKVLALWFVVA